MLKDDSESLCSIFAKVIVWTNEARKANYTMKERTALHTGKWKVSLAHLVAIIASDVTLERNSMA